MGHFITQLVSERTDCEIVAGVDLNVNAQTASYPAYTSIDQVTEVADVIIDFSHPSLLTPILHYAAGKGWHSGRALHHGLHSRADCGAYQSFRNAANLLFPQHVTRH